MGKSKIFLLLAGVAVAPINDASARDFASEVFHTQMPKGLARADLVVIRTSKTPKAVLVLCPGCNEDGGEMAQEQVWQQYARLNEFALVGLSFASDPDLLREGRGYYYTSQGSGDALIRGLNRIYKRDLPLILFGFSGGAHFVSSFAASYPKSVQSWCAYSAGWWPSPVSETTPPGVIACGELDNRFYITWGFFRESRKLGAPLLWIPLRDTGHARSYPLEEFVRHYFSLVLGGKSPDPKSSWWDMKSCEFSNDKWADRRPTVAWLPSKELAADWCGLQN